MIKSNRRGKRELHKMSMTSNHAKKSKKKVKKLSKIILCLIALIIVLILLNEFIIFDNNKTYNLVINNNNITANLKNEIIIENDTIYLSKEDISNFFDKYIY